MGYLAVWVQHTTIRVRKFARPLPTALMSRSVVSYFGVWYTDNISKPKPK